MASNRPPRRMTAEQAMEMFSQDLDSDDDLAGFLSASESDNDNESTLDSSMSDIDQPSTSTKGKGKAPKRRRVMALSEDATSALPADREWREIDMSPENKTSNTFRFSPQRAPGLHAPLDETSTPIECLRTILSTDIMDHIIRCINDYAEQRVLAALERGNVGPRSIYRNWSPISRQEFFLFFAVIIVIGMDKRPRIRDYWAKTPQYWYTPWFSQVFPSRERFEALYHTMLHVGEAGAEAADKVEPFLQQLTARFQEVFYPGQDLALDEMVIGFKGRWKHKQFNASKPKKYHIKSFGLCDSNTGFVYDLLVYFGKNTSYVPEADPDSQQAVKVFQTLLRSVDKGHTVFADRYYTSRALVDYLLEKETNYTGTLMTNRTGFPKALKTLRLPHRGCQWFARDEDDMLCVAWRDKKAKKPVVMVSTDTTAVNLENKDKPAIIERYNYAMNGCDVADQNISYYGSFQRRSKKWWKKIFYWLLEICQMNALVLHSLSHPNQRRLSFRDFKSQIVCELTSASLLASAIPPQPAQPVEAERVRFPAAAMHLIEYTDKDLNCRYCSGPGAARKRTNYVCSGCTDRPHLHPKNCFLKYHKAGRHHH